MYQKDAKRPIWRDPTNGISTPIKTIHDYFRNSNRESNFLATR
jgi:hypothetical protein